MKILVITTFYPHPERKDLLRDTSAVHYLSLIHISEPTRH